MNAAPVSTPRGRCANCRQPATWRTSLWGGLDLCDRCRGNAPDSTLTRLTRAGRMLPRIETAFVIRDGVNHYLSAKYGAGDKNWHPLFTATRELFAWLIDGGVR